MIIAVVKLVLHYAYQVYDFDIEIIVHHIICKHVLLPCQRNEMFLQIISSGFNFQDLCGLKG